MLTLFRHNGIRINTNIDAHKIKTNTKPREKQWTQTSMHKSWTQTSDLYKESFVVI